MGERRFRELHSCSGEDREASEGLITVPDGRWMEIVLKISETLHFSGKEMEKFL